MKEVHLYNSLSNKVEKFVPNIPNEVSMYVCGPTVYNYPHIGNMRPVVVFDTLRRFFTYLGYKVTYVSNFTDVDDKIIKAAKQEGKSEKELTDFYISKFLEVTKGIGSMEPDITPRVTEYIPRIISYIENLIKLDAAYIRDGDVYFRVSKIKDYGSLSNINIEDLIVGARVEENTIKESPLDFALWKKTNEGISWPSPWGNGRPGWHTECCVMIDTIFPSHFIDIHGGGYDLKFPHHENEIAQSEATHGNKIAKYWMHNGFINFGNEKMSKSIGNVVYAKDLINQYGGAVTRLVILSTHYRLPVNFTEDTITASKQEINKIESLIKQLTLKLQIEGVSLDDGNPKYMDKFLSALADDLNTSNALSELYNLVKLANQALRNKDTNIGDLVDFYRNIKDMLWILGLDIPYKVLSNNDKKLYQEYLNAKQNKDFSKSDALRNELILRHIL